MVRQGLDSRPGMVDGTLNRDTFWQPIEHFGPSWQMLEGSGGSPFESSNLAPGQPATDRY